MKTNWLTVRSGFTYRSLNHTWHCSTVLRSIKVKLMHCRDHLYKFCKSRKDIAGASPSRLRGKAGWNPEWEASSSKGHVETNNPSHSYSVCLRWIKIPQWRFVLSKRYQAANKACLDSSSFRARVRVRVKHSQQKEHDYIFSSMFDCVISSEHCKSNDQKVTAKSAVEPSQRSKGKFNY